MDKSRKRNKSKNIKLIDIILIILPLTLMLPNIYLLKNNTTIQLSNNELKKETNNIKEKLNNISKENKELEEKISVLNNLDASIEEAKQNYFNTLKILEEKISNKETDYKLAYITFDDGPYYSTYEFLKVLDEADIFATFFTTNVNQETCYDNSSQNCHLLYNEYLKYGHTIANHTYTHSIHYGLYTSGDSFINAIKKQEEHVKNLTGYTTNIARFPGGTGTANAYHVKDASIEKLKEIGYGWVDWTAQDGDGGYVPNTEVAWSNFTKSIDEDIEVVLFHDYSRITIAILPDAIKYLKDNNYILAPLFYESKMVNK